MKEKKKVALVAHDNMKRDLAEWVDWNWEILLRHHLVCTGTTGKMVTRTLTERGGAEEISHFDITLLKSGPLGGDQQLGSMIADGEISALIFFWDPMSAQPHDVDVKALLRIATLYNVPTAINRSSADFLISSPLFEHDDYRPVVKDYTSYIERVLKYRCMERRCKRGSTDPLFRLQRGANHRVRFPKRFARQRGCCRQSAAVPCADRIRLCLSRYRRRTACNSEKGYLRITVFFHYL